MKTLRALTCLFIVCIALPLSAQESVLWEISGNGLKAPSFVYGTLKFIGEKEFVVPAEAHSKLKQSERFAIEDQVDHHAQHELNKAVHFPEGRSLQTELSSDDYQAVVAFFQKEFNISASQFEHRYSKLTPLALSITMTRLSLGEKVKFYDIELLLEAKKNKLETFSLEPIEREAEALKKYPMADQVQALMHSVKNFEKQKKEFQELMANYPQGDLKTMFELTLHPFENNAVFVEEFYSKRNEEWLPKIDKMIQEKPSFIAVGISHLEGERGILSLLKSKGYTLTPIKVSR